jgi:hypothetical protein
MKPSMARRSGSVTVADVPFEERRFDFLRRGFFDTGICLAHICLCRLADNSSVTPHASIVKRACPPFGGTHRATDPVGHHTPFAASRSIVCCCSTPAQRPVPDTDNLSLKGATSS